MITRYLHNYLINIISDQRSLQPRFLVNMIVHDLDPESTTSMSSNHTNHANNNKLKNTIIISRDTYVSENDFLVFLWRFETAILAANCNTKRNHL